MSGNQYNKVGTLVAATPVTIDIFALGGFKASCVLIVNDDNANTLTVRANGVPGDPFPITAGEALIMKGAISQVKLESAAGGTYRLLAAEDESDFLPWIMSAGAGGGAAYVADETSLHLAGLTFEIKALGVGTAQLANLGVTGAKIADLTLTSGKVLEGIAIDNGMSAQGWFDGSAGQPVAGDTLRVQMVPLTDQVYTWVAGAPAAPGEVQVGGTIAISMTNLEARITLNQGLFLDPTFDGVDAVDIWTNQTQGYPLTLTVGAGLLVARAPFPDQNRAPQRIAVMAVNRVVIAADVTRGIIKQGLPNSQAVLSAQIQWLDAVQRVKAVDCTFSIGGNNIAIFNAGAAIPFIAGDSFSIIAICRVS